MFDMLPIPVADRASAAPGGRVEPVPDAVDPEAARRESELADCSGAIVAKLVADAMGTVADLPDSLEGDQQIFDLITANARVSAWAAANQATLVRLAYERAWAEHRRFGLVTGDARGAAAGPSHRYDDVAFTSSDIAANLAMELGLPMPVAEREVAFALGLTRDEPVRLALAAGRLDVTQARAVVDELSQLSDPEVRRPVAAALVTDPQRPGAEANLVKELRPGRKRLWDLPPAELRSIIRREAGRRDPTMADERVRSARTERQVRFHARRDAMAELVIHGPAETMAAAYQHLNFTAHAVKHQHGRLPEIAGTSLDALRHDIALGWLTQGEHGSAITYRDRPADPVNLGLPDQPGPLVLRRRPQIMVNLTVADTTLLGLDELPATLHTPAGPMTIPAELGRELAYDREQATWRRVLCDPRTGVATDVSRSYRPPPRIAEFVKVRDGHRSRFPGSNASHLELDHVIRYRHDDPAAGGPTTAANLSADGRRDHHLKTDGAISVAGDANGPLTYRGRAGHDHLSWPYQYVDPDPGERPGPPPDYGDPAY